jgi:uncharacterized Fe-S cluster-containing radical SAM superfamily protein
MQKASPKCFRNVLQGGTKIPTTNSLSETIRRPTVDYNKQAVLLARFPSSRQAKNLNLPATCNGYSRIHHFIPACNGWVENPLPMLPASEYLNLPLHEITEAQVFQYGDCNYECWFCFVEEEMRSRNKNFCELVSIPDLMYQLDNEDKDGPRIIDLSGGQPDLAPEYVYWFLKARDDLGLNDKYFMWANDNLSTFNIWKYLNRNQINFMSKAPGFARVGCLKGFDPESFAFNTGADSEGFYRQIEILGKLVSQGFDQFGHIVLTALELDFLQNKMHDLFDRLQEIHENLPLRIIPLQIFEFGTNNKLFVKYEQAIRNQFIALEAWKYELENRFEPEQIKQPITKVRIR